MAFNYAGDFSTQVDEVRFYIQDTVEGSGVKPEGGNFTDEEITYLINKEGSVQGAVAAIYETLETSWAQYIDTKIGTRDEKLSQIPERYRKMADRQRKQYGLNSSGVSFGYATRDDGYSQGISSGEE